jgi:ABC-type tungstate transport system permease subunit
MITRRLFCSALAAAGLMAAIPAQAQERFITVSSTTSTEQSGLFGHLLPAFERASGIKVRVVALGTGQALGHGAARRRPTWSSCTTRSPRKNSSPKATASSARK